MGFHESHPLEFPLKGELVVVCPSRGNCGRSPLLRGVAGAAAEAGVCDMS